MAKAKSLKEFSLPDNISKAIEAIAKGIGIAAVELWSIFVRQWFVKGMALGFTGLVLVATSAFLYQFIGLWGLIPVIPAITLFYSTIMLMGNPKYYALNDITERLKDFKKRQDAKKRADEEACIRAKKDKEECERVMREQKRLMELREKDPVRYSHEIRIRDLQNQIGKAYYW